jgi:tetratricopeptide (TPR) repeat protein
MIRTASLHTRRPAAATAALALLTAIAVVLAPVAPTHAQSPRDDARKHFQRGQSLYQAAHYREAIAAFAEASALAPSPILEFNIGLCHDRLGERAEAVRRYRAYLEQVPDAANRAAVERKVAELERALVAEAEAASAEQAAAAAEAEAARRAAEAAAPPPPEVAAELPTPSPSAPAPAAPTGDPELDRVAAVDVQAVRERYRGGAYPPAVAAAPAAGSEPGPAAAAPRGGAGEPTASAPPPPVRARRDAPVYKQWWFWVFVGVGAILLIDIASNDSSSTDNAVRGLESPAGPPLFRF